MKRIKAIVVSSILILSVLSACGDKKIKTDIDIEHAVSNVETLMNMRFRGISEDTEELLNDICASNTAAQISERLKTNTERIFISLESYFQDYENDTVEEMLDDGTYVTHSVYDTSIQDPGIEKVNGERGIYDDRIYVHENGRFLITVFGNVLELDAPAEVLTKQLVGKPSYLFEVINYGLYDNGMLVVTVKTDLEGAFKETYKDVEIVDVTDERLVNSNIEYMDDELGEAEISKVMTQRDYDSLRSEYLISNNEFEFSVKVRADSDGRITDINIDIITEALE